MTQDTNVAQAHKIPYTVDRLNRLSEIEQSHFWFGGRRHIVDRLLDRYVPSTPQLILDIGCGTGAMAQHLTSRGHRVVALDMRPEGLTQIRRDTPKIKVMQADATKIPVTDNQFDLVILLDVMEHVEDGALSTQIFNLLKPGGLAILSVPAMEWLWSFRDEAAGHMRRYSRRTLASTLDRASLYIEDMVYYQCLLFPLMVLSPITGRRGPAMRDFEDRPPRLLNAIMGLITKWEVTCGDMIHWPWGSTLVVACRKPC